MSETAGQINLMLEMQGCIFLKDVIDRSVIEQFNIKMNNYFTKSQVMMYLNKPMDMDLEDFYVNNTYSQMNNFEKNVRYNKPVVENRGAKNRVNDINAYDFHQAQKLFPDLLETFNVKTFEAILNKTTSSRWKFDRANIHISNHVTNPIGFHSDGLKDVIRVMIYLSDIPETSYGTPSFIQYSHTPVGKANGIKREYIKTFTGTKGDVLISYENGLHRKLPQTIQCINGFVCLHFVKS
jgi:hypothetical protein